MYVCIYVCTYVCMYVFMLEGPNENRQCAGVHELNPLHQAEVGGCPRLRLLPFIFRSSSADAAAVIFSLFSNRIFNVLCDTHVEEFFS